MEKDRDHNKVENKRERGLKKTLEERKKKRTSIREQ